MKKLFFLMCVLLSAMLTFAQNIRKVAILEVVDREGRLSYGNKMMLRSNLARAITNTAGFEAYDRTDMDAIMSEHDFQRTGMVSDDQIRQLGQMTGVSLILVAEAALVGNNSMFVSAKILNVETAKVEMMDNITMGLETMAMQQGCTTLANRLFGTTSAAGAGNSQLSTDPRRTQYTPMSKREYEYFLFNNCPKAYEQYRIGKQLSGAGWGIFFGGMAIGGAGVVLLMMSGSYNRDMWDAGLALTVTGFPLTVLGGIPLLAVGGAKKNKAYKIYNEQCSATATPITFNLTAGQNGVGIAMQF